MRTALIFVMAFAGVAHAQSSDVASPGPKPLNLYDHCMMHAAIRASRTDARDGDIYRLAKASCVATRASVIRMHSGEPQYLAAFNAMDARKARNFPSWIRGVRARRAAYAATRDLRD